MCENSENHGECQMDKTLGPRKVLRAPALRRGREIIPISDRVKLERVLGLTVSSNAAFVCDSNSSIVAYPAGCVVVLYNVRKNKQHHILSSSKKTITCLAFSCDGKYLVTGECGHQPHVRVWDVQEKCQIAEFQGHKYGINCVAFSPNLKYVVSVGSQHDMIVNLWEWKNDVKIASNKVSRKVPWYVICHSKRNVTSEFQPVSGLISNTTSNIHRYRSRPKVKAISFAANGSYFVTVGNRHVKFWYLESSRTAKHKLEAVPLMGRSAILGDQRNNYFCDVACGRGNMADSTYAITKSGLLCEFNSRRLLDKWVELRTTSANSISVGEQFIFIGCASGVIRCFNPYDLNFICTLPRPHYLGIDVARGIVGSRPISPHPSTNKYPDTIAISLDEVNRKVNCIYNDHSLYVWDIKDMKKIGKSHSFLYHSACIWGIETYPDFQDGSKGVLPKGTFLTCSSDDTIRFWNMEPNIAQDTTYHRNIYSSELLKILYIDPELTYLCDVDFNPSGSTDKVDTTYDGKNGVRCLKIGPNGKHLASGDRSGNIRIYDLETVDEVCKIEAHDSEVLCLEYSKPLIVAGEEKKYLASASRDRLIHVFDVRDDYSFQQTLDDHSSSITAVRFVQCDGQMQLLSCGADKSIFLRRAFFNPELNLVREHHVFGKTTLYDMEVDMRQQCILTACQDRNIRVYAVVNGKQIRCFRGSQGEDGTLIKAVLDPSGTYLATSCTDKSLYIYDYASGECIATMFGHSELVTGLTFTSDGQNLISVSGDGCIFMWRLPTEVTQTILAKQIASVDNSLPNLWHNERKSAIAVTKPLQLLENAIPEKTAVVSSDLVNGRGDNISNSPLGYRFSMGQLPLWAKKQILEDAVPPAPSQKLAPPVPPRGRWAQRIDGQGLIVRSYLDSDSVIPYPNISEETDSSQKKAEEEAPERVGKPTSLLANDEMSFQPSEQSYREIMSGSGFESENAGRVTLRRGTDISAAVNGKQEARPRPSATINGMNNMKLEDMDAEDERSDSEISEMVYYPVSEDGSDPGDGSYHVCANDGSEDVKEHSKPTPVRQRPERLNPPVPSLNTPEQMETNSDEEEVSTPVDSDKSFVSGLCVSTENLEKLGQREKFMRSNYESLEKDDSVDAREHDSDERSFYRQSISAKFLASSCRTPVFSTSKQQQQQAPERQVSTPTSKREELNKALNEAKKKLETVGYRRGLSSSKSIGDLHDMPDKDSFRRSKSATPDSDIRRATSMTDLSLSSFGKHRLFSTPTPSKSKKEPSSSAPLWDQSNINLDRSSISSPKPPLSSSVSSSYPSSKFATNKDGMQEPSSEKSANMSRSISMSSLHAKNRTPTPSIMHKTSSAYVLSRTSPLRQAPDSVFNRSLGLGGSSNSPLKRKNLPSLPPRTQPLSVVTTSTLATDSSSDSSPTESMPKAFPPHQPTPRPRFLSTGECEDEEEKSTSRSGLLSVKQKSRSEWSLNESRELDCSRNGWLRSPRRHLAKLDSGKPHLDSSRTGSENIEDGAGIAELSFLASDPASVPLTQDLCERLSDSLKRLTTFAMQIYQRITLSTELPSELKLQMSNSLAQGVWQAQQTLRPAMPPLPVWPSPGASFENRTLGPRRLPGLGSLPNGDLSDTSLQRLSAGSQYSQPDVIDTMALLQQFSDKLLTIVEQQISSKASKEKTDD